MEFGSDFVDYQNITIVDSSHHTWSNNRKGVENKKSDKQNNTSDENQKARDIKYLPCKQLQKSHKQQIIQMKTLP